MFNKMHKKWIEKYRESGDYTDIPTDFGSGGLAIVDGMIQKSVNSVDALFILFEEIPDSQKYQIVMDVYTMLKSPAKEMIKYLKAVKPLVPDNLTATIEDYIDEHGNLTIYRGGIQVKNPALCPSWTLSREQAEFFAKRLIDEPTAKDTVIYRGFVKATDIIGYTNEREEQEIIQYRSVKNIEIVSNYEKLPRDEIEIAVADKPSDLHKLLANAKIGR